MGGRTGLRYADCIATLSAYLPQWQTDQPDVWAHHTVPALMQEIQIVEAALLSAWGDKADADAATRKAHGPHH